MQEDSAIDGSPGPRICIELSDNEGRSFCPDGGTAVRARINDDASGVMGIQLAYEGRTSEATVTQAGTPFDGKV